MEFKEVLETKAKDLTEDQAFIVLFYTLITKNDYYRPLYDYMSITNTNLEQLVKEIARLYKIYDFVNPYKFLDVITHNIDHRLECALDIIAVQGLPDLETIIENLPDYSWD